MPKRVKVVEDYFLAGRDNTPPTTLQMLAHSACPHVRTRVAENRSTPIQTLERLSQDVNVDVRIGLGCNQNAPPALRWKLAFDDHLDVRFSLADNANTPLLILVWLSSDDNPYIAHRANKTISALSAPEKWSSQKGDINMAAETVKRTLRRMLSTKERLSKANALRLRELILADGYLSRSERKVVQFAMENDLLEDAAFEIFLELLLDQQTIENAQKAIA